jgi:hypothetical protein
LNQGYGRPGTENGETGGELIVHRTSCFPTEASSKAARPERVFRSAFRSSQSGN